MSTATGIAALAATLVGGKILLSRVMPPAAHETPKAPIPTVSTAPVARPSGEGQAASYTAAAPPTPACKGIAQGFVPMSDSSILDMVKPPSSTSWSEFTGVNTNIGVKLFQTISQALAQEALIIPAPGKGCPVTSGGRPALYTNAEQAIPGLNTINALPAGRQLTSQAISSIPDIGGDLNFGLTTSPRGLASPATGAEVSSIGNRLGSGAISTAGQIIGPAAAVASIVLGFEEDGVLGGIANALSTVAFFDPEPISRAILTIVGAVFGAIFSHHAQKVALETAINCSSSTSCNDALASIESNVMKGNLLPEHASQLLDNLYNEFLAHWQKYGLYGKSFNPGSITGWKCNAACFQVWSLQAIIIRKKDRYGRLTNVPCLPPPTVKPAPAYVPQVYVNPAVVSSNEQLTDSNRIERTL